MSQFQAQDLPAGVEIQTVKCLGQCGSGPMVMILPQEIWYSQVQPSEVEVIVQQHLGKGEPVTEMLYPKFHTLPRKRDSKKLPFPRGILTASLVAAMTTVVFWLQSLD